jgi:hypothetical protein
MLILRLASGQSRVCPVPRMTPLFFGAAKDIPEATKMVTAGTARYIWNVQANGQTWPFLQAALRPLTKCTTKEITAISNRR